MSALEQIPCGKGDRQQVWQAGHCALCTVYQAISADGEHEVECGVGLQGAAADRGLACVGLAEETARTGGLRWGVGHLGEEQ